MSINIDWSKAPEGYPLWIEPKPNYEYAKAEWHKEVGDDYFDQAGCRWSKSHEGKAYTVYRQPSWSGEGTPSVGTVCEIFEGEKTINWEDDRKFLIGKRVTVQASFRNGCDQEICAIELDTNKCFCILAKLLRPLRTPEQIAAEAEAKAERDQAVKDACAAAGCKVGSCYGEIVAKVIDAGFRKVGGAQ